MGETKALTPRHVKETAIARLDPQSLLSSAVQNGAGIETLERLVALAKDVRADQAREAWHDAMSEFQRTCPPIKKTAQADTGRFRYRYAPLDEIMSTILPVMGSLGLSVSWRGRIEPGAVVQNCRVSHTLGHSEESGEVSIPVEAGDRGATPPQRVGIATTYAKRYALLSIIGLAPEDDDDAQSAEESPKVQQPRRASAAPPKADARVTTSDEVTVLGVALKNSGTNKNGPWSLFEIEFSDGVKATTFSDTDADIAAGLKNTGEACRYETKEGKYGPELTAIEPAQ